MTPSILYFSPQLASWKAQLVETQLLSYGKTVEWQAIQGIDQSPVTSLILLAESDISAQDWPMLSSRRTIIILEEWNLDRSIEWIKKGATNCFAYNDNHLISWLISELSKFALTRSNRTEDDILQVIIDAIPAPIFFKDQLHIYRGCNAAFCESIGRSRNQIIGHSVYDIAPKHLADKYYEADCKLLAQGGTQRYEAPVQFCNAGLREIEFNKAVFTKANGQIAGQVGVMLDITERNQLMHKLEKATRTDPLTGIGNRREFNIVIHEEFDNHEKSKQKLSLMTLDVDFFKKINDKFGHGGGDQALQLIANWLQNQLRGSDNVFRVGGEEFYVLMRNTDMEAALKMAESLCKGMSTHSFTINQQEVRITLSAGVIELDPSSALENALEMVDKALYEAKSNGRNCVCPAFL